MEEELVHVEESLWVLAESTGLPIYDFDFCRFFSCRHPWQLPDGVAAVARIGAFEDYGQRYRELSDEGIFLINSPDEHLRAGDLPHWYALLEDLTPKSIWFSGLPDTDAIAQKLHWPIFMKGQRQTSRHKRSLSIIEGPEALQKALDLFRKDPILGWQQVVCREYVRLRPVEDCLPDRIPSSFEFRTFWWRGVMVGIGRYWWEGRSYEATEQERTAATAVAGEAARRLCVPFLVVDVAQTTEGRWIVIECNDAQESGYAGVPPIAMWQNVIEIEKRRI